MTTDAIAAPKTGRIAGTLHKRGYVHPVPERDEKRPGERAQEREVAGHHRDSGQADQKTE